MTISKERDELFESSHLTLLISYTVFSAVLIAESLLMRWELWALVLILASNIICWILHVRHNTPANVRVWIYSILMMCTYFFYGTHATSTFDLALVMSAVILVYTMTGKKSLITLCQFAFVITMTYEIVMMVIHGEVFDALVISRTVLHYFMVLFVGQFSKKIIDTWMQVLTRSEDEVIQLTEATDRLNDFLAGGAGPSVYAIVIHAS